MSNTDLLLLVGSKTPCDEGLPTEATRKGVTHTLFLLQVLVYGVGSVGASTGIGLWETRKLRDCDFHFGVFSLIILFGLTLLSVGILRCFRNGCLIIRGSFPPACILISAAVFLFFCGMIDRNQLHSQNCSAVGRGNVAKDVVFWAVHLAISMNCLMGLAAFFPLPKQ